MKPMLAISSLSLAFTFTPVYAQPDAPTPPDVLRLDQAFDRLVDAASSPPKATDVENLTQEIRKHADTYRLLGHSSPSIYASVAFGDGAIAKDLAHTRKLFAKRDLTKEITELHRLTFDVLGRNAKNPPIYYVVYGYKRGTNARTMGGGAAKDGRTRVYLNLVALSQHPTHWKTAVIHETVHTMQNPGKPTLLGHSILEAVATYISQSLQKDVRDEDAMFWSVEQWKAAEERRDRIIQAFAEQRNESAAERLEQFLYLGVPLKSVAGAPDRTGYYVGYLAVKAWVRKNPKRPLADLLTVEPQDIWAAFVRE